MWFMESSSDFARADFRRENSPVLDLLESKFDGGVIGQALGTSLRVTLFEVSG